MSPIFSEHLRAHDPPSTCVPFAILRGVAWVGNLTLDRLSDDYRRVSRPESPVCVLCRLHRTTVGTVDLSTWATWEVRATHLGYRFAEDSHVMVGSGLSADNASGRSSHYRQNQHRGFGSILGCLEASAVLFERGKSGRASLHSLNVNHS